MLHIFLTAANAVLPIVLLILLGNLLRKVNFLNDNFIKTGNKLVFRIGLTCSLFVNVYNIPDFSSVSWSFVGYVLLITVIMFVLGYITAIKTTKIMERRGVVLQCVFRSNFAIIGMAIATALGGEEAAAVSSLVSAFVLPVFNIMGVIALTLFVRAPGEQKHSLKTVLLSIVKNPMIIGAFAGLVCVLLREVQMLAFHKTVFSIQRDIPFLFTAVSNIKSMTTPLALIITGAQFQFSAVKGMYKEILVGTLWRIVIAPVIGIGGALLIAEFGWISCGTAELSTMIALFGAPAAVSSAVMAGEMGSDEQLATQHVVWTTIGSALSVFLIVSALMMAGILNI